MTHAPNVLLLDQDDVLRRATALLLSHRGAGVSPAATLEEAISLSQERVHDVALIDISPSMPGARELLRRLRREGLVPLRIVLSASELPSGVEAGSVSEILIKPYPFDQLMAAIFGEVARARRHPEAHRAPGRAATRGVALPRRRRSSGTAWTARAAGGAAQAPGGRTARAGVAGRGRDGRAAGEGAVSAVRAPRRAGRGRPHRG